MNRHKKNNKLKISIPTKKKLKKRNQKYGMTSHLTQMMRDLQVKMKRLQKTNILFLKSKNLKRSPKNSKA